jgi:hypothetical protein
MLFEVFRLKTPPWYTVFLDGKRLTSESSFVSLPSLFSLLSLMLFPPIIYAVFGKNAKAHQPLRSGDVLEASSGTEEDPDKVTLVDHYVGFMLAVFAETGLIDVRKLCSPFIPASSFSAHDFRGLLFPIRQALIDIIEENHNMLSRKATLLVGELLAMANKLLPSPLAARIQVSRLYSSPASLFEPCKADFCSSTFSHLRRLYLDFSPTPPSLPTSSNETRHPLLFRPSTGSIGTVRGFSVSQRVPARKRGSAQTPSKTRSSEVNVKSSRSRSGWVSRWTTNTFLSSLTTLRSV